MSALPYGPNTVHVRRFLVQFAGLSASDRAAVVARYVTLSASSPWLTAEGALATAIERSGREPQRDALSGPLLQLVRRPDSAATLREDEALAQLDPVAEPALAALLALLVKDLLPEPAVATLMEPFAGIMDGD